jgi:hypothetical protein
MDPRPKVGQGSRWPASKSFTSNFVSRAEPSDVFSSPSHATWIGRWLLRKEFCPEAAYRT